ncbi:MAG: LacI family DNA-binding transcriptional regulator [Reyranellaceae bacterium]
MKRKAKAPTIRDVAKLAGVSVGTVSRVMNGEPSVNDKISKTVLEQIRKLGYVPNPIAQGMRNHSTRMIGCIIRDISVPAMAALVKTAQQVLQHNNYLLLVLNHENDRENELHIARVLESRLVDGLIWMVSSETDPRFQKFLADLSMPAVLVDRTTIGKADSVMVDHYNGVTKATDYLLTMGHRRIALISTPTDVYSGREKLRAFSSAYHALGLKVSENLVRTQSALPEYGYRETLKILSEDRPPTAIISGAMGMLPGVLRALRARSVRVPNDISLISICDSDLGELSSPPITTVRWDLSELGRIAAELLLDRIQGRITGNPKNILLPTEFLVRQSCTPPSAAPAHSPGTVSI